MTIGKVIATIDRMWYDNRKLRMTTVGRPNWIRIWNASLCGPMQQADLSVAVDPKSASRMHKKVTSGGECRIAKIMALLTNTVSTSTLRLKWRISEQELNQAFLRALVFTQRA
jgi:hypothetical protein